MPVAGAVKLDIIADSQDRASAVLRQVQGELKRTEDRIRATSAAAREDVDISEILARGSGKARQELKAEVDMREAAAQKRRELVRAAREGVDATNAEGNALVGLKGKIEAASRAKELLNKVLGLTGFITIAAGAVSGIVALIESLDDYKATLKEVEGNQERFNELVGKLSDFARENELRLLTDEQRDLKKATEDSVKLVDDFVELQQKQLVAEGALAQAVQRRAGYERLLTGNRAQDWFLLSQMRDLDAEIAKLERDVSSSKDAQAKSAEAIKAAVNGATPAYREQLAMVREMVELQAKVAGPKKTEMEAAVAAIDLAKKAAEEGKKKGEQDEKAGAKAGARFAERERELSREVAILRAATSVDEQRLRTSFLREDVEARRVGKVEAELILQKQQLEQEREIAKFNADVAASNEAARKENEQRADRKAGLLDELALARARTDAKRDEIALANRLAQIERDRKAGRLDDEEAGTSASIARAEAARRSEEKSIEERAKGIERIGRAAQIAAPALGQLSGRLSGLAGAVDEVAKTWATFERGQVSLGDAVSGTLGILGHAIAQSISDKRVQAGVEGAFESAASIASFAAGNVPAGIGHATAAAAFFAVAAGAGGASQGAASGGAAAGGGGGATVTPTSDAPSYRRQSSWQDDRRELIIVQAREGIIYGLSSDVARVASGTARSLRGTGMERRGF